MLGIVKAAQQRRSSRRSPPPGRRRLPLSHPILADGRKILTAVAGQQFAVAVGEIGAGGDRDGGVALSRVSAGDMDKTDSHRRESGNTTKTLR